MATSADWGNCDAPTDPFSLSAERTSYLSRLEHRLSSAGSLPACRVSARDLADEDNPAGMRVLASDMQRSAAASTRTAASEGGTSASRVAVARDAVTQPQSAEDAALASRALLRPGKDAGEGDTAALYGELLPSHTTTGAGTGLTSAPRPPRVQPPLTSPRARPCEPAGWASWSALCEDLCCVDPLGTLVALIDLLSLRWLALLGGFSRAAEEAEAEAGEASGLMHEGEEEEMGASRREAGQEGA